MDGQATQSRVIDIAGVPVLFERSRRARHISLSVRPFRGARVAVPRRASFREAREFAESRSDWIVRHLARMREKEARNRADSDRFSGIEHSSAAAELTSRLARLAEKHGFSYNRVSVRDQKTRWGSCSADNNISLNMKLVRLPEELADYVLLHELAHTRIKDHGPRFWAEMDRLVGDGRKLSRKLKKYGLRAD